jgi:hypothetical protein
MTDFSCSYHYLMLGFVLDAALCASRNLTMYYLMPVLCLQRLCPEAWRPSRLESECIRGDGFTFTFPQSDCSPFQTIVETQLPLTGRLTIVTDLLKEDDIRVQCCVSFSPTSNLQTGKFGHVKKTYETLETVNEFLLSEVHLDSI